MRRTAMLWEVFVTRFQQAFEQYEKHRLSSEEAGELLGMSGRNFRRLCRENYPNRPGYGKARLPTAWCRFC